MAVKEFYYFSDNTFFNKGAVWFYGAYTRSTNLQLCPGCRRPIGDPEGIIEMQPNADTGVFWPDAAGVGGGVRGLYLTEFMLAGLRRGSAKYGRPIPARVMQPYPRKLRDSTPPSYFHIALEVGAKLDFESSGFAIRSVCLACGRPIVDPASQPKRYKFIEGTWNGADIFCTDLSPTTSFCSNRILELAKLNKWTNLRFVPLDEAYDFSHKGIDYLNVV